MWDACSVGTLLTGYLLLHQEEGDVVGSWSKDIGEGPVLRYQAHLGGGVLTTSTPIPQFYLKEPTCQLKIQACWCQIWTWMQILLSHLHPASTAVCQLSSHKKLEALENSFPSLVSLYLSTSLPASLSFSGPLSSPLPHSPFLSLSLSYFQNGWISLEPIHLLIKELGSTCMEIPGFSLP